MTMRVWSGRICSLGLDDRTDVKPKKKAPAKRKTAKEKAAEKAAEEWPASGDEE
jgi:hypothetical protein